MLNSFNTQNLELPIRPPKGCKGRRLSLLTNCYDIEFKDLTIYLYTVNFFPAIEESSVQQRRKKFQEFFPQLRAFFGHAIFFDNLVMYSLIKLRDDFHGSNTLELSDGSQITLIFRKEMPLNQSQTFEMALQILHVMLRRLISEVGYFRSGAKYFKNIENNSTLISVSGLDQINVWNGFSVSMESVMRGLVIKVDPSYRVVYKKSLYDLIAAEKTTKSISQINAMLKGLCMITIYNKRVYRISGYEEEVSVQDTFYWRENDMEISYADYAQRNYNIPNLKHPNAKGMLFHIPNRGSRIGQKIMLIPELCFLTGMSRKMKSNMTFTRKMADATTLSPSGRFQRCRNLVASLSAQIKKINNNTNNESNFLSLDDQTAQKILKLPFDIRNREVQVEGRELPRVQANLSMVSRSNNRAIKKSVPVIPDLGKKWTEAKFNNTSAKKIKRLVLVASKANERNLNSFVPQFKEMAKTMGLLGKELPREMESYLIQDSGSNPMIRWENQLIDIVEKGQRCNRPVDFILFVIPENNYSEMIYNRVKEICYVSWGIQSQGIRVKNIRSNKCYQAIKGCLKQMMAKMNNRLWDVRMDDLSECATKICKSFTMVVGIDVCHDWKAQMSTVGVCISNDKYFTRYWSYVSHQKKTVEIVQSMQSIMKNAFLKFFKLYKKFPRHIFVYRDGVSESQISMVCEKEVKEIFKAFDVAVSSISTDCDSVPTPLVDFIVVQKNVSIRFVTKNMSTVPPGTVVDDTVTSRRFWDFYLTPHNPPRSMSKIKKTANPTRFIVVREDNQFSADDIELLSNYLCSIYFNFPGPIKVPAPSRYADRIAFIFSMMEGKSPHKNVMNHLFML